MFVLIVECNENLGEIWEKHLGREGLDVQVETSERRAIHAIRFSRPEVIVLNVDLHGASALAISDFAAYHVPDTKVIFVSGSALFSDGSIFAHAANACAFVAESVPPGDLCAMVEYYGAAA